MLVSLEDELVTVHAGKMLRRPTAALLGNPEKGGAPWAAHLVFRKAQLSAERLHARMRHNLLKMDEQLGDSLAFSGRTE